MMMSAKIAASVLAGVALGFDPRHHEPFNATAAAALSYTAPAVHLVLPSPLVGQQLPESVSVFFDSPARSGTSLKVVVDDAGCDLEWMSDTHARVYLDTCATPLDRRQGNKRNYHVKLVDEERVLLEEDVLLIDVQPRPWPFSNGASDEWPPREPNLVGNIMENYQSFSGANSAYMHEGLDIRSADLQDLHSPTSGRVVRRVNYSGGSSLYWSLMVQDDDGFVWQFHHLEPDTHTVREGDQVQQGEVLGKVCTWPALHNGVRYHHVHMNVAWPHPDWSDITLPYIDGWRYYNPMMFLDRLTDNTRETPTSDEVFYFHPNDQPNQAYASTDEDVAVVQGNTDLVVNLHSLFEETNDLGGHPYTHGLYQVAYQVTPAPSCGSHCQAVPLTTLATFDTFPGDWPYNQPGYETARSDVMLRRIYCQSFRYQGRQFQSVFNYNQRQLYYTVTNTHNGQPDATLGFWDTVESGNGEHDVTVFAEDFYGRAVNITHRVLVSN